MPHAPPTITIRSKPEEEFPVPVFQSIRSGARHPETRDFRALHSPGKVRLAACLAILCALTIAAPHHATAAEQPSSLKISSGIDYTSGDYGTGSDTQIVTIPTAAKFYSGPWMLGLTVPIIHVDGNAGVLGGTDGTVVVKKGVTGRRQQGGLGDIVGSGGYTFFLDSKDMPLIDLIGKIKFPTAEDDLGTGEFDFSIQTDIAKAIGRFTPFGTLGYRFVGGSGLNDIFFLSFGASYKLNEQWNAGLIFDYRQSTSDQTDDPAEFTPFAAWAFHKDWSLMGYGVIGATDGSPDYGGGIQVAYTLDL